MDKDITGSETWTKNGSPHKIKSTVTILEGATLTIEPGVEVEGFDHYNFFVAVKLIALCETQRPFCDSYRITVTFVEEMEGLAPG